FYTVAVDAAGNREAAPSSADATTVLDTIAPSSTASAPAYARGPFTVTYSASDASPGVDQVGPEERRAGDAADGLAATDRTPATASFTYGAAAGDGTYSFYTVAVDAAGNREAAPSSPDATTTVDTGAPSSSASAPAYARGPFTVTYSASDANPGVDKV